MIKRELREGPEECQGDLNCTAQIQEASPKSRAETPEVKICERKVDLEQLGLHLWFWGFLSRDSHSVGRVRADNSTNIFSILQSCL